MSDFIEDLLSTYDAVGPAACSLSFLKGLLKELRRSKIRRPDIVVDNWQKVLYHETGNEVWNLHEQILVASLDLGDNVLAEVCLEELKKKFPASIRVGRLEGLIKEQQCEYEAALDIYKELLSRSPGNLMVMKRRACVFKAMGDAKGEIDELNSILKQFPADSATWQEMGDVYLSAGDHTSAAHCFEEIVLLSPGCAHHHSRLADVYFSIGAPDQLVLARKHYSLSLTMQGPRFNLRALYGLLSACRALQEEARRRPEEAVLRSQQQVTDQLAIYAVQQLQDLAATSGDDNLRSVLQALSL